MTLSIENLQAYLRNAAARTHEVADRAPFRLFFNPHDALRYYNYGIPTAAVETVDEAALEAVRAAFRKRERLVRFEFIREYAPSLGAALEALGVPLEARNPLLVCTPDMLRHPPAVPGLEVRALTAESDGADLRAFIDTQRTGFGEEPVATPDRAVDDMRGRLRLGNGSFLALIDATPAAAASHLAALDGFAEVAGIATLPPYRRRGIAAALTAVVAEHAFTAGAQVAFLTAADEDAARVYERAGFKLYGMGLAYCEE